MTGHEKRAEKKKESIRQASINLFSSFGIKKVSMTDIAQKANVSKVSIYNYFKSKDELIFDVIKYVTSEIQNEMRSIIESDLPFEKKLEKIIFYKSRGLDLFRGEFIQQLYSSDSSIRDFYEKNFVPESYAMLHRFFTDGKDQGYLSPDISIETFSAYIQIFQKGLEESPSVMQEKNLSAEVIQLFFYGLLKR